jgi:ABC-2 type transport system ATP-binding protein
MDSAGSATAEAGAASVPDGAQVVLEIEAVTKRYRGSMALDGVSFALEPGVFGLLGPNGAGKSTLIKALMGLVRISSGEARVLGLDSKRDFRHVRELVGYMPEDDCIFPGLQGVESVSYAGELAGLPRVDALRRAHEVLDYVGLGEERYREVQTYSTGMRQKQKLAQAIVHDPRLVFLDEPTSGLDPLGRKRMLKLIRGLYDRTQTSVVLSTHILHDVEEICDSVVILGHGKLLVHDTMVNLSRPADASVKIGLEKPDPAFGEALDRTGVRWEAVHADELRIYGDPQTAAAQAMEAARASGVLLRRIESGRNTLEEIFLEAVEKDR